MPLNCRNSLIPLIFLLHACDPVSNLRPAAFSERVPSSFGLILVLISVHFYLFSLASLQGQLVEAACRACWRLAGAAHWLFAGFSLASHWQLAGFLLASPWLLTGFSLAPHFFTGCPGQSRPFQTIPLRLAPALATLQLVPLAIGCLL